MPRRTQKINGTEYVYEYDTSWLADKKYATHKRTYIGKMVDGVFVANKKYLLEQRLEAVQVQATDDETIAVFHRNFCGATWLFDEIGIKLGITEDQDVPAPFLQRPESR